MKKSRRNLLDDECRHCLLSLQTPCCLPNLYRVQYRVLASGGVFKSIGAESKPEFGIDSKESIPPAYICNTGGPV
jgi:hypothetical protein